MTFRPRGYGVEESKARGIEPAIGTLSLFSVLCTSSATTCRHKGHATLDENKTLHRMPPRKKMHYRPRLAAQVIKHGQGHAGKINHLVVHYDVHTMGLPMSISSQRRVPIRCQFMCKWHVSEKCLGPHRIAMLGGCGNRRVAKLEHRKPPWRFR